MPFMKFNGKCQMIMKNNLICFIFVVSGVISQSLNAQAESLPPLKDDVAPQTFKQLWAGYDPRAESLEIEILKKWEEDGVVLNIVRYRIGIFRGQKAKMAAVYGYAKGGRNLPGLVQIHGGGQYADYRAVLTNAKRGYATISIAWAGRISAPGYVVNKEAVKLFWDGKTDDPRYKLTTDWGALDAYHAPCRNPKNAFAKVSPEKWTLDTVESPRNNPWFLCTLGARRALTFLEQQEQVNGKKLGVYGHSMGGKLTVTTTAADTRVRAAAPSCGGISDRYSNNALYRATIDDSVNLKHITCPIVFLSPSNDFHGRINHLPAAVREIKSKVWRVTCSPHHNHQDTAEYEVATQLWFDQHLKGNFNFPETPKTALDLDTIDGIPSLTVEPDTSQPILYVDIYYTQQGQEEGEIKNMANRINRFWHHAKAQKTGDSWTAPLPILSTDKPLWVYANILYPLAEPVTGAGYYYGKHTASHFNLSSVMSMVSPAQLKEAGIKATMKPSLVIEDFSRDWKKEWFIYSNDPKEWQRKTHKLYNDKYQAPAFARMVFELRSEKPNKLVLGLDTTATEIELKGGGAWQKVVLYPTDFKDADGGSRTDWKGIKELRLSQLEELRPKAGGKQIKLGAKWKGAPPEFRSLRWVSSTRRELNLRRRD